MFKIVLNQCIAKGVPI